MLDPVNSLHQRGLLNFSFTVKNHVDFSNKLYFLRGTVANNNPDLFGGGHLVSYISSALFVI